MVTIGAGEVEVAHEALLREWPRLRGWLEEDAEGRHLHHQLRGAAREWDAGGRDPGELYRGARLAAALDWFRGNEADLNATERAFLAASRAAGERSQRRLRAMLAGVAALLVLAVIAGLVALGQRGKARDEATAADAQRLGARALVEPEFDRSLLLARQGVALDDTVQTRGNLLAALLKSPAALSVFRAYRPEHPQRRAQSRRPHADRRRRRRQAHVLRRAHAAPAWRHSSRASTGPPVPRTAAPMRWHTAPTADGWPSRKGK